MHGAKWNEQGRLGAGQGPKKSRSLGVVSGVGVSMGSFVNDAGDVAIVAGDDLEFLMKEGVAVFTI